MSELTLYRPGDGVLTYVEVSDEVLESDSKLGAALKPFTDKGFVWVPDVEGF